MVHGTTADHRRWETLAKYLDHDFTLYALDRRGRGGSGDSPDYELAREAEDIAAVAQAAAVATGKPVSVLAHSHGATCSLEAAPLTDSISHLILYEPPIPPVPPVKPELLDRVQDLVDSGSLEEALELFFRQVANMPDHEFEMFRKLPMWSVRVGLAGTIPRELRAESNFHLEAGKFAALRMPTLILVGGDSPVSVRRACEIVHEALPDSRLVVMPGEQHIAMDTNPKLLSAEVRKFLLGQE